MTLKYDIAKEPCMEMQALSKKFWTESDLYCSKAEKKYDIKILLHDKLQFQHHRSQTIGVTKKFDMLT